MGTEINLEPSATRMFPAVFVPKTKVNPVKVVKVPAAAVEAPITVPLIPVEVVLKLLEVMVNVLEPVLIDDIPRPVKVKAPDVPVRLIAPVARVKPLVAVKVWMEVNAPVFVVVMPVAPIVMAPVFVAPIVIVPFVDVPVPAVKTRPPPVEPVPLSFPPLIVNSAPVPEFVVFAPGRIAIPVGEVPAIVVKS